MSGPIIGINFGNAYASIAVVNKEGHADCIANEDGERQIACAISYAGQQVYIGNGALPQLVKNSKNTITGFRNLLGKKFGEFDQPNESVSAPVVDLNGDIGYTVTVLVPPPPPATPLRSATASQRSTPAPTRAPSPPAPVEAPKSLTVRAATADFLRSLRTSAEDFLGKPITGAVLSFPDDWSSIQAEALKEAAEDAGIHVLQLADEGALAVLGAYDSAAGLSALGLEAATAPSHIVPEDRTSLVLDLGASSLTLRLLSIKDSTLSHPLITPARSAPGLGGDAIDNILITHFLKEFTKKNKIDVSFPTKNDADARAVAKLRLAVEHTKKALQASSGAAACSVESLHSGVDFSGTINRIRFDSLLSKLYTSILGEIIAILADAKVDKEHIDEVLLVGGSSGLSGLVSNLENFFGERSKVVVRAELDGSQLIAKGAALQAKMVLAHSEEDGAAFAHDSEIAIAPATVHPIGLVFPGAKNEGSTIHVILVPGETPLPARRTIRVGVAAGATRAAFEVWEAKASTRDLPAEARPTYSDDEDEDDEEPAEVEREAIHEKETLIGGLSVDLVAPKGNKKTPSTITIEVRGDVDIDGSLKVSARQVGLSSQEELEADKKWISLEIKK